MMTRIKNIKNYTMGIFFSLTALMPLGMLYMFEKDRRNIIRVVVEALIEINSAISGVLLFFSKFNFDNLISSLKNFLLNAA
jgi:hypothetical protein